MAVVPGPSPESEPSEPCTTKSRLAVRICRSQPLVSGSPVANSQVNESKRRNSSFFSLGSLPVQATNNRRRYVARSGRNGEGQRYVLVYRAAHRHRAYQHHRCREIGRSNRNIGRRAVIPAADDMGSLDAEMREQLA